MALAALAAIAVILPGVARADDHKRGEAIFELCQQCHQPTGEGMPVSLAPAIAGLDVVVGLQAAR